MKREIETKFYTFNQNNSGGYFVTSDEHGVSEYMIIEATSPRAAWERLEEIGEDVDSFWNSCSCCGDRWSNWLDEKDGKEVPSIYGTPVEEYKNEKNSWFNISASVHYFDKTFKNYKFEN